MNHLQSFLDEKKEGPIYQLLKLPKPSFVSFGSDPLGRFGKKRTITMDYLRAFLDRKKRIEEGEGPTLKTLKTGFDGFEGYLPRGFEKKPASHERAGNVTKGPGDPPSKPSKPLDAIDPCGVISDSPAPAPIVQSLIATGDGKVSPLAEPRPGSVVPNSRSPLIPDDTRAKIAAIEAEARAKGWPAELLWNNVFWGGPRGLAAVLEATDEVVEVTDTCIVILTNRRDLQRFPRYVA